MTKKGGTRGMAENVDWGRKGSVLLRLLLCLFSLRGMGSIMFMFFLLFFPFSFTIDSEVLIVLSLFLSPIQPHREPALEAVSSN